jgi:hypothetical protein
LQGVSCRIAVAEKCARCGPSARPCSAGVQSAWSRCSRPTRLRPCRPVAGSAFKPLDISRRVPGVWHPCKAFLVVVPGSSDRASRSALETVGFVGERQCQPPLLLVVPSERLRLGSPAARKHAKPNVCVATSGFRPTALREAQRTERLWSTRSCRCSTSRRLRPTLARRGPGVFARSALAPLLDDCFSALAPLARSRGAST